MPLSAVDGRAAPGGVNSTVPAELTNSAHIQLSTGEESEAPPLNTSQIINI